MAKARPHPKPKQTRHYIKEWRKHRGLSQERLAERIEKTHGAISQLETGVTDYTQGMLESLAQALNVEPGDLLTVDPNKEGQIVDLLALLRKATPEQQRQALAVVETLLKA